MKTKSAQQAQELANIDSAPLISRISGDSGAGVYLANATLLEESHLRQQVTDYATGWMENNPIAADLNTIAPAITVSRWFDYKTHVNGEEFLSESDEIRAIDGEFKRVQFTGDEATGKTYNKGLTVRRDKDAIGPGGVDQYVQMAARRLTDRLLRNDLRRAGDALVTASANTAKTWDSSADPDADLLNLVESSRDAAGISPNLLVFGPAAWVLRITSLRASSAAKGFAGAGLSLQEVADYIGVERAVKLNERYQTQVSGSKSKVLGSYAIVCFSDPSPTTDDPSTIKRFVTPCEGGEMIRVYVAESMKFIDVTVEHYSNIITATTTGAKKYTVS